jgi:hypothetical protein
MTHRPPLTDSIAFALGRMVDDAQVERRDPSHSDIEFCITKCNLTNGDPNSQGQTVGKAKRIRSVLSWAIEHSFHNGCAFVGQLVAMVASCGGFRVGSPNYVGEEAIISLREAMASEGFVLTSNGELRPVALNSLSGAELTEALAAYVRRAQRGAEDAALLVGTGKDLLEAISAHVLRECWGQSSPEPNFPTLLGKAFVALDLKTPEHRPVNGEPPQHRLQRALYDAACAVNTLRNKQGTGHGRPWLPSVSPEEARHVTQVMGIVGELLLQALRKKTSR